MNILQPWNIVFVVGFVVYVGTRHRFEKRAKGEEKTVQQIDGLEKGLIGVVALGSLLIPVLYLLTPLLSFANYTLPKHTPWLGLGVMIVSLWLFWRSHADLGKNWSVSLELRQGHQLITHGVYKRVRHPMYSAIWLWGLAQALLLHNWIAGYSALITFAPLYLLRTPREEKMMAEQFGDAYRGYMQRTGRIFPTLFSRQ